jgi:hypothetical protein
MKATTLLLSQHHRIQRLIDLALSDGNARDIRTSAVIEAVLIHLETEEIVFFPAIERQLSLDLREHRQAHVRARLALFRLATAPTEGDQLEDCIGSLRGIFRDHALRESQIVRVLEESLSDTGLRALGEAMQAFQDTSRDLKERALAS